jgi:SAM-dependent methyltransferase
LPPKKVEKLKPSVLKFMKGEIKCIVCDHSARIAIEKLAGYQKGQEFEIYYCPSCNTSFAWPHEVDDKIYDHIYSQISVIPGYNRYAAYADDVAINKNGLEYLAGKEANYFSVKEILGQNTDKKNKILEVGSGLGYLTYAIYQQGYDITGLDISSDAVKESQRKFGNHYVCQDVYQYAMNNPEKFDIVILTEVIEHVQDPKGFCKVLISLLKAGGKLIITTPNKSAYSPEAYWETELPPVHLTWFSENSFKAIAENMGLKVSFFDFTGFNKKQFDISRFKFYNQFYKIKKREHILNEKGKVISPATLIENNETGYIKLALKKFIRQFFIYFLTHKKTLNRNSMLSVILQKN